MQKHASADTRYRIHILHSDLSDRSKELLGGFETDRFSVRFEDVTGCLSTLAERFPLRDYYSKTTYYRLFIPDLFPEYRKALYIDSDTIVRDDLSGLYATELTDDDSLAACREQVMVQNGTSPETYVFTLEQL